MFRKILVIIFLLSSSSVFAQTGSTKAPTSPTFGNQKAGKPGDTSKNTTDYREPGNPLPNFMVRTLDGKTYTNKDVEGHASLFVMVFNPTCEHCENATKMLQENIDLFDRKKCKILLVTSGIMGPYLELFEKELHTDKFPSMLVGLDSSSLTDKLNLYKPLPYMFIYDRDRKLVKVLNGDDVTISALRKYIKKRLKKEKEAS